MPWWSWIWIGLLAAITAGGAVCDRRDGVAGWIVALDVAAGLCCIGCIAAFHVDRVAGGLGSGLVGVVAFALVWSVVEGVRDVRSANEERGAVAAGVVLYALAFGPAIVLGALAARGAAAA